MTKDPFSDIPWQKSTLHSDKPGSSPVTVYQKLNVPYKLSGNANQILDICIPASHFPPPNQSESRSTTENIWIIYIHGGAWRDPTIRAASIQPAQTILLTLNTYTHLSSRIAGLASIHYTLSPYPHHPTDPSSTADPSRNAKHPDHLIDIHSAIAFLQNHFGFGEHYALVGHSCGATLAFQSAMTTPTTPSTPFKAPSIARPMVICGLAGLYDLPALSKPSGESQDKYLGLYRELTEGAFGPEGDGGAADAWVVASPTNNDYRTSWPEQRLVVVAYSVDDSIVPLAQYRLMIDVLRRDLVSEGQTVELLEVKGDHDEMWEHGGELARAFAFVLDKWS